MKDKAYKLEELRQYLRSPSEYGRVVELSRRVRMVQGNISTEKAALRRIERRMIALGTLSLGNVEKGKRLIDDMRDRLKRVQALRERETTLKMYIKAIILPAKKKAKRAETPAESVKDTCPKYDRYVFTREEALKFIKTLTDYVTGNKKAQRLVVEIDSSKRY